MSSEMAGKNTQETNLDNFGLIIQSLLSIQNRTYDEATFSLIYDMYSRTITYKKDGVELHPQISTVMTDIVLKVEKLLKQTDKVPRRVKESFDKVTETALRTAYISNKGGTEKVANSFDL
jgi:hypothetical protein